MRISLMPRVCSGLLCGSLLLFTGCSNPSSENLASLSVTATPTTLSVGGASILHAVAHLSDGTTQDVSSGTTWTVSNPTLGTVASGALNAKAAGTLTVQAAYIEVAPAGNSPASATTTPQTLNGSATITIMPAGSTNVPTITWPTPAPIAQGTALSNTQLDATANVGGTFSYTPAAGTVLPKGNQTLTAVFTPSDTKSYSSATASVQLSVGLAVPVITWATPAPITTGTALSATQLNATSSVPGTFVYSPAAGAVLAAGTQALNAAFTPTDTTNYASATAKVSLLVNASGGSGTGGGPVGGPVGPTPTSCGGPTVNINSGMSNSAIQSALYSAPSCSLVVFAAGTYNITNQLTIPCNNLQITGPVASIPTAILAASFTNNAVFAFNGNCANLGSVTYLHFENTGAAFIRSGNNSNLTFEYNLVTNLPSGPADSNSEAAMYFDGNLNTTLNNIVIKYNTFGDSNSCTAVFGTIVDDGGYCAGIYQQAGIVSNWTIDNNIFEHLEEGVHFHQICNGCATGTNVSVLTNIEFAHNYIHNWHRIGLEVQSQVVGTGINGSHNVYDTPLNPSWGTMAVSMACCTGGRTAGTSAAPAKPNITNDNVIITTVNQQVGGFHAPVIGIEMWGGTQSSASYNYIGGGYANQINWGYNSSPMYIENNFLCAPGVAAGYITDEEGSAAPTLASNTINATCSTVATTAPTITQSGSGVTITDAGVSGANQAISIYYTTDGSSPTVSSTLYTGPFTPAAGAVIKAIGMWGVAPQPTSFPSGLGYVPSNVVTATFGSGSVIKAPGAQIKSARTASVSAASVAAPATTAATAGVSAVTGTGATAPTTTAAAAPSLQALTITPSAPALTIGGTTQLKAVAAFDDGSTRDVTSEIAWQSSDPRTIAGSSSGAFSGLATGKALLIGSWQGRQTAVLATSSVGDVEWSAPIVINQGGTYSGNWQSTDGKTAAVTITTKDPVILQDAHLRSTSSLIKVNVAGADVTVRNSIGIAVSAAVKGQANGVFLDANAPARLDVENNYMENVRDGVLVSGYSGNHNDKETLVIRGNRARNLNGMLSDGAGGYLPGEGNNRTTSRFIELDNVQSVAGVEVGWNEVVDNPTHSLVSDVISVYRSSGTANGPLEVHDTYIQGAYAYKPAQDAYQGGGIKTDGAADDTAENASAFTYVHDNQVVGTSSYGIAFRAGHDNVAANNRVISNGLLGDGTKIAAQRVGLRAAATSSSVYNNTMHDNLVGWACWTAACGQQGYRRDQYLPASPGDYATNSKAPITLDMEEAEYQLWLSKTASAGIHVGPSF
jgi:Chitobiase/beta-hexosaminidase C-terminal domain